MEPIIKPIETVYQGYRFRSRLEARWAVFFDTAGIRWEYEKEGFELSDGTRYLPDFYLPEQEMWVEIKGSWPPSHPEMDKVCLLPVTTNQRALLFAGFPWPNEYTICVFFAGHPELRTLYQRAWLCQYGLWICGCGALLPTAIQTVEDPAVHNIYCHKCQQYSRLDDPRLVPAYTAARQARFEYGERGRRS